MMPLTLVEIGKKNIIKKIGGRSEIRKHLENLVFVVFSTITIFSQFGGNLIINIKESRIAISREIASKIMV
ncbi:MAG: ferrous iron transport protein A [Bacillales bacterium]|nr:ferrous iron transport protein A [Bacillales bacterium]